MLGKGSTRRTAPAPLDSCIGPRPPGSSPASPALLSAGTPVWARQRVLWRAQSSDVDSGWVIGSGTHTSSVGRKDRRAPAAPPPRRPRPLPRPRPPRRPRGNAGAPPPVPGTPAPPQPESIAHLSLPFVLLVFCAITGPRGPPRQAGPPTPLGDEPRPQPRRPGKGEPRGKPASAPARRGQAGEGAGRGWGRGGARTGGWVGGAKPPRPARRLRAASRSAASTSGCASEPRR